jgi:hypothetical protein
MFVVSEAAIYSVLSPSRSDMSLLTELFLVWMDIVSTNIALRRS